jgi:hypothetical protein
MLGTYVVDKVVCYFLLPSIIHDDEDLPFDTQARLDVKRSAPPRTLKAKAQGHSYDSAVIYPQRALSLQQISTGMLENRTMDTTIWITTSKGPGPKMTLRSELLEITYGGLQVKSLHMRNRIAHESLEEF